MMKVYNLERVTRNLWHVWTTESDSVWHHFSGTISQLPGRVISIGLQLDVGSWEVVLP